MKIFMSNYILKCRICSKLPENRVSWEKNRVSREKIEFWAFGQNRVSLETHKKKAWQCLTDENEGNRSGTFPIKEGWSIDHRRAKT